MNILQRILEKKSEEGSARGVSLLFLGDSVTQGCFELYKNTEGKICAVTDAGNAYAQRLHAKLCMLYPDTPFHAINVGLSGDRAPNGFRRLAADVLSRSPDLTVVCYGLNDCSAKEGSVEKYTGALEQIFAALREAGSEILFMTPNTMCFYVSPGITDSEIRAVAAQKADLQTQGVMDRHIEAAVALCHRMQIRVCDCYAVWQAMQNSGVDTTALLSNAINHPTREMQELFAVKLLDALFEGGE